MTEPFDVEMRALLGDKLAVLRIVGALRWYRSAALALMARRYSDGQCDGHALTTFQDECEAAEQVLRDFEI